MPVECPALDEYLLVDNPKQEGRCWHTLERYRELYPNHNERDDDLLAATLYEKAGIPLLGSFEPWRIVFETAGVALGVPLAVLLIGLSLMWAISGFSPVGSNQPVQEENDGAAGQES